MERKFGFFGDKEERDFEIDDISALSSDTATVIRFAIDSSGSMKGYDSIVPRTLVDFKDTMLSLTQVNSIRISICTFNAYLEDSGFRHPSNMDTSYVAVGGTALYDAIGDSCDKLCAITDELNNIGIVPKGLLFVLSDGGENESRHYNFNRCKDLISKVNELGYNTVYVSFGEGDSTAADMGFDIVCPAGRTAETLKKILGAATKSVQSISQSAVAKPDITDFFADLE